MSRPWIALLLCGTAALIGQTGRDAYRQAYDAWQQTQANLEIEAGTGGAPQVSQADRSAVAAASFGATRIAHFKSSAQEAAQRRQILQTAPVRPSPDLTPPDLANLAAVELQTVTRASARFATDKDPGIQQVRQALERERVALVALDDTIQARQKAVAATSEAATALEQSRARTAEAFAGQAAQFSSAVAEMELEANAWAKYYDQVATAIQTVSAPAPPPAAAPANTTTTSTTSMPRNTSVSPVPLVRYIGDWSYPKVNGIFHGVQPESAELAVHENNGHLEGTVEVRFKPSPGVNDPSIRLKFEGDIAATPTQKFTLMTADGAPGTIELIPGPAFNLLEVNFQTEPRAGTIRNGNFILLKK